MGLPAITVNEFLPWDAEENRGAAEYASYIFLCPSHPNVSESLSHYVGIAGLGDDAPFLTLEDRRVGAFGYKRKISHSDISDGLASTVCVAETANGNGPWVAAGPSTARPLDTSGSPYLGPNGQFNSHHVTMNLAFFDGSVRSFRATLDRRIFEALATIQGGEGVELPQEP